MQTKMAYGWKIENLYPVSAQVAGEELEKIRVGSGKEYVDAADVLDASRPETAPLHCCFEWNDDIAAEKYRLSQSKKLIQNVIVVQGEKLDTTNYHTAVRAFVSVVPDKTKAQFTPISIVLQNDDYKQIVLRNILIKLREIQNTYKDFKELSEVFKAIDNFADSLK